VRLWDGKTGTLITTLTDIPGLISFVQFSRDGRLLLAQTQDGATLISNGVNGTPLTLNPNSSSAPICEVLLPLSRIDTGSYFCIVSPCLTEGDQVELIPLCYLPRALKGHVFASTKSAVVIGFKSGQLVHINFPRSAKAPKSLIACANNLNFNTRV
jgi:WD40 repeat protein